MFLIDPVGLQFTNLLVGLMAMAFLLLSHKATSHVRTAVYLWVLGDAMATLGRLALLGQPGVLHTEGMTWLTPITVDILHGSLIVASAALHTLSLRAALTPKPVRGLLLAMAPGVALGYAALAPMLSSHGQRVQGMLAVAFVFVVWSALIAWPQRRHYRGAWMACGVMAFFAAAMIASVVGISVNPTDPASTHNLPPMPALIIDLMSALAMTMSFTLVLFESLQHRIELIGSTDALTGVLNRRGCTQQLTMHWAAAKRQQRNFTLALLDLDHFKNINDTYGHAVGDEVLAAFAGRISKVKRASDVLARWGGEEFLLLMPDTDSQGGLVVMERARAAIAASPLTEGAPIITFSAGLVAVPADVATGRQEDLLAWADARLYQAKVQRNCVVAAGAPAPARPDVSPASSAAAASPLAALAGAA